LVNVYEEKIQLDSSKFNGFFPMKWRDRIYLYSKDLIRFGVPVPFRPLLWQCLTNVETSDAKFQYADLMKMTSPCEKVIRRDINRTYPEHEFFKEKHGLGQESLFNVIKVRK